MKSVGEQLKLARLHRHWTPQAAAKATKIKVEQLLDLENDAYNKFASPSYARGFVRIYARTLGLDERKILAQLDGRVGEDDESAFIAPAGIEYVPEQVAVAAPVRAGRIGQKIVYTFGIFFGFIVAVILIRAYQSGVVTKSAATTKPVVVTVSAPPPLPARAQEKEKEKEKEKEIPKAIPVEPATAKVAAVAKPKETAPPEADNSTTTAVSTSHQLTLQAPRKSSWVRVTVQDDGHDKQVFEGVIEAGESKSFDGQKFNVKVATPAAVDVILDGENYGPYSDGDSPESFTLPNIAQSD